MTTTSKKCSKCGEVKGLDEFSAHCQKKDGKRPDCKDCEREVKRRYREQNREKIIEYDRQYREQNREKISEYHRQHYKQNREKIQEHQRQYYARQKAMREFFRMHKAMAEITEALQQYMQP